ncbi:TatD family hydrolase [Shewanella sp. 202IG2-18]|uniref:TatD family hydrolase n=1 Tax=Parashewanella hymeniacidonis TaxID=2807618 RepID=UPI00195F2C9E|nr:TatD family hydrolase [Parashewanella hymeniacidonis]MBM7073396.1 TatD family hydrolase [Parashewanella hymeniacidonis]
MTRYIDIAVNLIGSKLEHQIETVLHEAHAAAVEKQIIVGSNLEESAEVATCCKQYPNTLFGTAGVHPHYASQWSDQSSEKLLSLLSHDSIVAVGECGLDFNRNFSTPDQQLKAFESQLEIAVQTQMPIYMHCRDAHNEFIQLVKQYRPQLSNAVLHCFTGSRSELEDCLELDLFIGITGWVCDERRGQTLAECIKYIPNDRLMLETDSPYLLPRNLKPKPKSGTNYPKYLPHIADTVANLRQQSKEFLAKQCFDNTMDFFGLE